MMYKEFYKFREYPFNVTSDPSFFYESARHSEAYSHLVYGIQQRKGIIVVTGEIGTGKTTLCRTLLSRLDTQRIRSALILNPNFSELQLLQLIVKDFGIRTTQRSKLALVDALNEYLLEESSQGHNVVLIIDESQNLTPRQLEQIRLLSNLETEKQKLLQIILVGQPELMDKLKMPSLRQLNQRVSVRFHVLPLERDEVSEYIHHRLNIARTNGQPGPQLSFAPDAVEAIYNYSKGTPRLINMLCDRALLAGFVTETFSINEKIIYKCTREVAKTY